MVTMTSRIGFFAVKVTVEIAVLSIERTTRSPALRLLAAPTDAWEPPPPLPDDLCVVVGSVVGLEPVVVVTGANTLNASV
jgi:hypothetical protein